MKKRIYQTFKELQEATQASEILSLTARAAWETDDREGECPTPSLNAIATYEPVQVAHDNSDIDWTEAGSLSPRRIREALRLEGNIYEATELVEAHDETKEALESIDKRISEFNDRENETLDKYNHICRLLAFFTFGVALIQELPERIEALHKHWKEALAYAPKQMHPLTNIVRAWLQAETAQPITKEYDKNHLVAILKHPMGSVREISLIDNEVGHCIATPDRVEQAVQMQLPFEDTSILPAIMPLEVVRTADMKKTTRSGAVSHEVRIFFEAIMALQPNQRREELMIRLGVLIDFLNPDGKFNWTNQIPHIERALNVLHSNATIPFIDDTGSLRRWRPVSVRAEVNKEGMTRETPIFFDVCLPPDAKQGHIILKEIHRGLSKKSAAKWNAYHVACYLWDKYGTVKGKLVDPTRPVERRDGNGKLVDADGKPLISKNGRDIKSPYHKDAVHQLDREPNPNSVKRYKVLSFEDLIRACYPNSTDTNQRRLLKGAKAHWKGLEAEGYIVIHKEGDGWRILPPSEHLNKHRAMRKAGKGVY